MAGEKKIRTGIMNRSMLRDIELMNRMKDVYNRAHVQLDTFKCTHRCLSIYLSDCLLICLCVHDVLIDLLLFLLLLYFSFILILLIL